MIVSFVTTDHYLRYGKRLEQQCRDVNMPLHIEYLEPFAESKREICLHRPRFMLDVFDRYGPPLVWFDADGDILEHFEIEADGAPAMFAKNLWKSANRLPITAGIFVIRDRAVLEDWERRCSQWRPGEPGSHHRLCKTARNIEWEPLDSIIAGKVVLRGASGTSERRP